MRGRRVRALRQEWVEARLRAGVHPDESRPTPSQLRRLKKNYNLSRRPDAWRTQIEVRA